MSGITPVTGQTPHPEPHVSIPVRHPEPPAAQRPPLTRPEAEHTAQTLNRVLNPLDLNLLIHYDDDHRTYGFKIVDRQTKEVIREFPFPGVLEAARDAVQGLFVDQHS